MPTRNEPTCQQCGRPMNDWEDLRHVFRTDRTQPCPETLRICGLGACRDDARDRGYQSAQDTGL